ncbi:hypothetical protein SCH4B_1667 [Ruegeria sp. TrichCH4B]|nr:hypothetical protein SCH4B_1667 [Ruegeria sp. TrichCH4B]
MPFSQICLCIFLPFTQLCTHPYGTFWPTAYRLPHYGKPL